LGGSRGGAWKTARNLLVVFTLCGLWHGANWPMVLWGTLNGLLLVAHRAFQAFCAPRPRLRRLLESAPGTACRVALTFLSFCLTLAIFRSPTLGAGLTMLGHMLKRFKFGQDIPLETNSFYCLAGVVVAAHLFGRLGWGEKLLGRLPPPVRGVGYA